MPIHYLEIVTKAGATVRSEAPCVGPPEGPRLVTG